MPKPSSCPQHHRPPLTPPSAIPVPHPIPSHPIPTSPFRSPFRPQRHHFHHVTHSPAPRSRPGPTSFTSEPNTAAPTSPPPFLPHLCSRRPTGRASRTAARPSGAAPSSGRRRCTPTAARTPAARPASTLRAAQLRPAGQRPLTPPRPSRDTPPHSPLVMAAPGALSQRGPGPAHTAHAHGHFRQRDTGSCRAGSRAPMEAGEGGWIRPHGAGSLNRAPIERGSPTPLLVLAGSGGGIWGGCGHKEPVGCWRRSEGAAGGTACVAVSQVVPSIVVTPGDAIPRRARDLLVTLSISGPGSK